MQLNLIDITYTYDGASAPTLEHVSVTFPQGWTGIVGDNGCGKTTMALLACGLLCPHSGAVTPQLVTAYCPQDSSVAPDCLEDFATDWGSEALRIREAFRIDEGWLWDFDKLSGGQKKRVQIACVLWRLPDVLVLDEPTNDLDAPTRDLLLRGLKTYEGIGIVIAHDRLLLDRLASQCVLFEGGSVVVRPGGYTKAVGQQQVERESAQRCREEARREEKRLHAEACRRRQEAARSKSRLSGKSLDKHDNDGRGKLRLARVTSKDGVAGRASAALESRLARAEGKVNELRCVKRYEGSISFPGRAARSRSVIRCRECTRNAGELTLHVPELWVGPTDRIGVVGANGAGKSTLIRYMTGLVGDGVECAFIPQEVGETERGAALCRLRGLSAADKGKVLSLVAGLNSDPDRLCQGVDISPGETKKLLIAEQLLREPNLLVLDEPTNHLDVGSIEALQQALASFPGAIMLVSHDRMMVDAVCDILWVIEREGNESQVCVERP